MDKGILRLLDANFNRAREALRVMEDYARFVLDDAGLCGRAKEMRHDLADLAKVLPDGALIEARDTPGDVGTVITTAAEGERRCERAVVVAAAKRLAEALRCLEEYSKIDYGAMAGGFESIRYRGYELEKQLLLRGEPAKRFSEVRLYVLLTEKLCRGGIVETAEAAVAGGADCIQLREKEKSDSELLDLAGRIGEICRQGGALFAMNDRADLAALAGADVLHLGQGDVSIAQAREIVGRRMVVGKSSHSVAEAGGAVAEGADYVAVGSIFGSETKPDVVRAGVELIAEVRGLCQSPIIAIGGVTAENAGEAIAGGADGVAVCQGVIGVDDPAQAARTIKQRVESGLGRRT